MDMDSLRYVHAVAQTRSLREAAARLHVDQTTVSRRVSRLEKRVGVRLFDRTPAGWRLTESGKRVLPHAEAAQRCWSDALEAVGGHAPDAAGTIRVLAPDGFGTYVLIPHLRPVLRQHPGLAVEVLTSTGHDMLTARDFDVAITLERPADGAAHVRPLADYELRLYASVDYLATRGTPTEVGQVRDEHDLVSYIDAVLDVQPLRILADLLPGARARLQSNNIAGHHAAARAGLGIVPLPAYIGAEDPGLREVLPDQLTTRRRYWLVTARSLATSRRVREVVAVLDSLVEDHPWLDSPVGSR